MALTAALRSYRTDAIRLMLPEVLKPVSVKQLSVATMGAEGRATPRSMLDRRSMEDKRFMQTKPILVWDFKCLKIRVSAGLVPRGVLGEGELSTPANRMAGRPQPSTKPALTSMWRGRYSRPGARRPTIRLGATSATGQLGNMLCGNAASVCRS